MTNSGRWLEELVKEIEQALIPEGFHISTNERVFDDSGAQLAEFDIIVTGKLGSTTINWLIECRDRPSQGAAPGEWILGLIGRRDFYLFNKVTAVSTTGFSQSAKKYAMDRGIDLMSVDEEKKESISEWFKLASFDIFGFIANLKNVQFYYDESANPDLIASVRSMIKNKLDVKEKILIHTGTGNKINILSAWQDILNQNPQLFNGIKLYNEPQIRTVDVNYNDPQKRYQIQTNEGIIHILQIKYVAEFSCNKYIPITRITKYSKALENESVAQSVQLEFEIANRTIDISFHNFGDKEKTLITAKARE